MGSVGFRIHAPSSAHVEVVSTFLARTGATMLGDSAAREVLSEIGRRSVGRIESVEVVRAIPTLAKPSLAKFWAAPFGQS